MTYSDGDNAGHAPEAKSVRSQRRAPHDRSDHRPGYLHVRTVSAQITVGTGRVMPWPRPLLCALILDTMDLEAAVNLAYF
jgi:hypothetical protein